MYIDTYLQKRNPLYDDLNPEENKTNLLCKLISTLSTLQLPRKDEFFHIKQHGLLYSMAIRHIISQVLGLNFEIFCKFLKPISKSFYDVNYGLSIIMPNVSQINPSNENIFSGFKNSFLKKNFVLKTFYIRGHFYIT